MSTIALKRNYQLEMPNNFVDVDRDEMEYVDGGYEVAVSKLMISSAYCTGVATAAWNRGEISWYNILLIAKEIRGHAVAYYGLSGLAALGISNSTLTSMRNSANPINYENGPDSRLAVVAACELIWKLPG